MTHPGNYCRKGIQYAERAGCREQQRQRCNQQADQRNGVGIRQGEISEISLNSMASGGNSAAVINNCHIEAVFMFSA